ncbi:MAG: hypothetical protein P8180_13190 [Gammaproteobacteria bacterium]
MTMPQPSEGYGRRLLPLLADGLRDRLRGEHGRANARWGHVRAPAGTGKLIWLKTGAGEQSVHLGAELLAAIRHKRLDVRLVLTFEQDFPTLVNEHLAGLEKVGVGYGPCDAPRAVRRTLGRLDPFAIIWVDGAPDPNLSKAAGDDSRHTVVFAAPPAASPTRVEAADPATPAQAHAWQQTGGADYIAPVADFRTLLVEAQVEPTLRGLVCAGRDLDLWWFHGADAPSVHAAASQWRRCPLASSGVLFVSAEADDVGDLGADLLISTWTRTGLAPGTVVAVDEARWTAAVATAAHGQHLSGARSEVLWQALAVGTPTSVSPDLDRELSQRMAEPPPLPVADTFDALLINWQHWHDDPASARRLGDRCRRRFWDERRRAAAVLEELLQRVFDW